MGTTFERIKKVIFDFWIWWIGELSSLVPDRVKKIVVPPEKTACLSLSKKKIEFSFINGQGQEIRKSQEWNNNISDTLPKMLSSVAENSLNGGSVQLELAPDMILSRRLILPSSARGRHKQIISLQFDRFFPLPEHLVLYDSIVEEKNAENGLVVHVGTVHREFVENIEKILHRQNLKLKLVTSQLSLSGTSRGSDIFSFLDLSGFLRPEDKKPVLVMSLMVALLLPVCLATYYYKLSGREEWLIEKATALAQDAKRVEKINGEIFAEQQQRRLYWEKMGALRFSEILSTLTGAIPDDSWVFELNKSGERLSLSGNSPNSSELTAALDRVDLFSQVANNTTVVLPGRQKNMERFGISLELRSEETADRQEVSDGGQR